MTRSDPEFINFLKSEHSILVEYLHGLHNLVPELFKNGSSNALTLQWVYKNLGILPTEKGILKLCEKGELDMIQYIYNNGRELLNNQKFVDEALSHEQWDVVKFFIEEFPHLIDMTNKEHLRVPLEIFEALESSGKTSYTGFITHKSLLLAISFDALMEY